MDKLQWFKFTPTDWVMGKIQRCPEITQARFMRLICLYWNKDCVLSSEDAEIEIDNEHLAILVAKRVVRIEDGFVVIAFLNEQMEGIIETSEKRRNAVNKRWGKAKQNNTSVCEIDTSVLQNDTEKEREVEKEKELDTELDKITLVENKFSTEVSDLSKLLFSLILENNPNAKKPDFTKWDADMDKINRIDKYDFNQIQYVIAWSQKNSFWNSNILSPKKLRDKMPSLVIKIKEEHKEKSSAKKESPVYVAGRQTQENLVANYEMMKRVMNKE